MPGVVFLRHCLPSRRSGIGVLVGRVVGIVVVVAAVCWVVLQWVFLFRHWLLV